MLSVIFASLASFIEKISSSIIKFETGRASSVLAGIISGHNYFQEKKFGAKLWISLGLLVGLILLTTQFMLVSSFPRRI